MLLFIRVPLEIPSASPFVPSAFPLSQGDCGAQPSPGAAQCRGGADLLGMMDHFIYIFLKYNIHLGVTVPPLL